MGNTSTVVDWMEVEHALRRKVGRLMEDLAVRMKLLNVEVCLKHRDLGEREIRAQLPSKSKLPIQAVADQLALLAKEHHLRIRLVGKPTRTTLSYAVTVTSIDEFHTRVIAVFAQPHEREKEAKWRQEWEH